MLIGRVAGAAAFLLLLTAAVLAQEGEEPRQPARVALVIGNDAYAKAPLAGPVEGAKAVAETLRQGGFDVVYAENARRDDMNAAIEEFGRKLERGARAVAYFSGYAVQFQGRNFLAPVDAATGQRSEMIDIDQIIDPLLVARPAGAVVALDASRPDPWRRSPPDGSGDDAPGQSSLPGQAPLAGQGAARGLAAPEPMRDVVFLYPVEPGTTVADVPGAGGLFGVELAKAMATAGLGFDGVLRQTRAGVKRGSGGAQTVWQSAEPPRDLVVTPERRLSVPPHPADPVEQGFWDTIMNSETAADFQAYLESYPNGRYAANARSRLRALSGAAASAVSAAAAAPAGDRGGATGLPKTEDLAKAEDPAKAPAADVPAAALRDCPQCPEMILIHRGAFDMGSNELFAFEGPVHSVAIARDFYIGRREVTFEEWDACVADGGCAFSPSDRGLGRGLRPVGGVDWNDAKAYTEWLSRRTGHVYRLPTESEWEYAARGGSPASYPWGRTLEKDRANCGGCTSRPVGGTTLAGTYPANAFGLFDMLGNVAEWVEDCWNDSYRGGPGDGAAWSRPQCRERVLRGGSFNNDPRYVRSAARFKYDYDVRYSANGFRVARED